MGKMKSIVDFINEKHNFLIKGHSKKQELDYVDMGFPSKTKWARCNLGATTPEDAGLLFQFGRLDGYRYNDNNHKFLTDKKYKTSSGKKYKKGDLISMMDDAALYSSNSHIFRLPTKSQCSELINLTKHSIETINNIKCMVLTSKCNDKQLVLPLGGYWDDTFDLEGSVGSFWTNDHWTEQSAAALLYDEDNTVNIESNYEFYAINIRPILKE